MPPLGQSTGPLRIAVMAHAYPPEQNAGAGWMLHSLLRGNIARGHECHVYLSRPSSAHDVYELDRVTVHPLDSGSVDVAAADVLIAHLQNVPTAAAIAHRHGVPFVHLVHGTRSETKHWLRTTAADLVVYNSEWMAADCEPYAPGIVVRPPVLPDDYRTTPGDKITLVNLNANKGGHLFWRLAAEMPDVQFLGVIGAYGEQITGDLPNVELMPNRARMRDAYSRTRVLLILSSYESWGRVGVEAMISGIPVVAHPTPGLRESLGPAGIFVDRSDTAGWMTALRELADEDTWNRRSRQAHARAGELDPRADIARWCDAIEELAL